MKTGDVAALPQLKCMVALEAQRAWHSYIKNGFLLHTDKVLVKWLHNEVAMRDFELCVRNVSKNMKGFSGSGLIPLLPPLSSLPPADRERLAAFLEHRFVEECQPDEMAALLTEKLDTLVGRVNLLIAQPASVDGDVPKASLDEVRDAARALWRELEKLPQGFWLPRISENSQAVAAR